MANYKLPEEKELADALSMIVGEDISVSPEGLLDSTDTSHVAIFQNNDQANVAICYCDWPLATGMSAALSMISPVAAEEMLAEKKLTENAEGNLYEVMNIISSLLMNDSTAHLKLTDVSLIENMPLPEFEGETISVGYNLALGKYGSGKIAFVAV